jgi:hypothetical protein
MLSRCRLLLRTRSMAVELDFDQVMPTVGPPLYLPISAATGGRYGGAVELMLRDAAVQRGYKSQFWATESTLRNNFDEGQVLEPERGRGVEMGLGNGPLHLYNVSDVEASDLHFFLLQNPLPLDDATYASHLVFVDGRWSRFKNPALRMNLDQLHHGHCLTLARSNRGGYFASNAFGARDAASDAQQSALNQALLALSQCSGGPAVSNGNVGNHNTALTGHMASPYSAEMLVRSPPRRWIHKKYVDGRLPVAQGSRWYDPVGPGGVLYNAEQTDRHDEIENAWRERLPADLRSTRTAAVVEKGNAKTLDHHGGPRGWGEGKRFEAFQARQSYSDPTHETEREAGQSLERGADAMNEVLSKYLGRTLECVDPTIVGHF